MSERILRGITWDHPRGYDSVRGASEAWAKRQDGVRVLWDRRSLKEFGDTPIRDFSAQYDLMVIDHPHVPQAASEGVLVPFDGVGFDDALKELAEHSVGASHRSYQYQGHQYGLAIDAAAPVSVHRPDLVSNPPRTWAAVEELAQAGRVLWAGAPIDAMATFFTLMASHGAPCGDNPGWLVEPTVAEAVFEQMHRLVQGVPSWCLQANPIMVLERLSHPGEWAYAPMLYGYVNYSQEGFRPYRLAFRNIPEGPQGVSGACLGGAGIAISASSHLKDIAMELAFWLASGECQSGVYFDCGGQPAHIQAWDSPALNERTLDFFSGTRLTLESAWVRPGWPEWMPIQNQASQIIHDVLMGQLSDREGVMKINAVYHNHRDA